MAGLTIQAIQARKEGPDLCRAPLVGLVETVGKGRDGRTTFQYVTHPDETGYLVTVTSFSPALTAPSSGVTEA